VLIVSFALLLPGTTLAQWSADPYVNLAVAAKTDEQAQPKVGTLPDGSAYISWFDNDPTGSPAYGYDVFLQYFDGKGFAQWDPNGIRIADRGLSWTTDYGFAVDAAGNALLAFNDDRSGTSQIAVTKVSPAGVQLWGDTGVQLTSDTTEKYAPDVVATSDGNVAGGWVGSNRKGAPVVFLAKLDANGRVLWNASISAPKDYTYDFSHIAAADNGSVILTWVRTWTGPFKSIRGLMAQKYSAKGRPQWGKGVVVLDTKSLQGGEFPKIMHDGAGGAVIGWYTTDPECYVQRLSADGVELFPHEGLAAGTSLNSRSEPTFTFDAATGDTIMVYNEQGPDGYGVGGQRFSSTGARLWTESGVAIRPGDWSVTTMWPTVVNTPTGALVTWIEQVAYPDSAIYGAKVDATGALVCTGINVTLAPGSKNRIAAVSTPQGGGIFAWEDGRNDFNDIYAQRLGPDCVLGLVP
jgi:hypothetical protein